MKDLLKILSIIFLGLPLAAQGQTNRKLDDSNNPIISGIEIFAGLSFLSIRDNKPYKLYGKPKVGYSFGVALEHRISNRWTLNNLVAVERKGYTLKFTVLIPPDVYNTPPTSALPPVSTEVKSDLNNDYLIISISPKYWIDSKLKVYVSAGPYYGRLIKSQGILEEIQNDQIKLKTKLSQKEGFKKDDVGIRGSIALSLKEFDKWKVLLQINYNYGLMNTIKIQPGIDPVKYSSIIIGIVVDF